MSKVLTFDRQTRQSSRRHDSAAQPNAPKKPTAHDRDVARHLKATAHTRELDSADLAAALGVSERAVDANGWRLWGYAPTILAIEVAYGIKCGDKAGRAAVMQACAYFHEIGYKAGVSDGAVGVR